MIELKNIVVKFDDFEALHNINVDVKEGEFFTFLGPSGCGKTTTLRTITGFIEPVSGSVNVNGKDITHVPIENRNIGIVFQSYALFPTMTVYDNIAFGLKLKKMSKKEIAYKVDSMLDLVNLKGYGKRHVDALSGGQQQRVAIARALATNPSILLADEPTGALDQKTGRQVMKLFRELNEEGRTIIMITHDVSIAGNASRIVRILDGELSEGGPEDA